MSALGVNIHTGDIIQQQFRGNWKVVTLIDNVAGANGENIASVGEDVSLYKNYSFLVTTDSNCTFYYQTSTDNTNWHDPLKYQIGTDASAGDNTEAYIVNNEKRDVEVTRPCRYIRAWVVTTAAGNVTVKLFARM